MVIDRLLDPTQATFIQDGSIVDNIYFVQELLRKYVRKQISPCCVLKVYLKKKLST